MPNILWICTDQQRFDSLGCYGSPVADTPNLDTLAREGTLFENCYSQSPVCAPSRAAFLTGRYPAVCGLYENGGYLPEDEVLVTRLFDQGGWRCGLAGKLHLAPCHPSVCPEMERRVDDGYRDFAWSHHPYPDWETNDYSVWLAERGQTYHKEPHPDCPEVYRGMPEAYQHTTYCTQRAIEFVERQRQGGQPWLFSLNFFDPHHDFDPPPDLLDKYLDKLEQLPRANYTPGELDHKPVFQQIDHRGAYGGQAGHPFAEMTHRQRRMHTAAYYAMVELIDQQVGRLGRALKDCGQYEDTLIVFTSDHGEMLGDHGLYLKGPYFYDCAVKAPLIFHGPGVARGLRSPALAELVDLPQTLLDAAGLPHHPGMMGRSLWPICTGEGDPARHRDTVFCEYVNAMPWHQDPQPRCSMVCDGRYKLAVCHGLGQGELYDLKADPAETVNRWGDPAWADVKLELYAKLADRLAEMRDPARKRVADW